MFPKCFKELFFRPPVPGNVSAIAKVNPDVNHNYVMKSVTSLHQLSLRIFFCLFCHQSRKQWPNLFVENIVLEANGDWSYE